MVARLNTYDKVQRRLSIVAWQDGDGLHLAMKCFARGEQVGIVTSVSAHPKAGFVGLAYVKRRLQGRRGRPRILKGYRGAKVGPTLAQLCSINSNQLPKGSCR